MRKTRQVNFKNEIHNLLKFQSTITGETITEIAEKAFMQSIPEDILKQYIKLFGLPDDSEILKYIDKDNYKNETTMINTQSSKSVKEEEALEEKEEITEIKAEKTTSDIAITSEDESEIDDELSCYF